MAPLPPWLAVARFTLVEEGRRLPWLVLAVALTGLLLALFAGSLAIAEARQTEGALLAAFLRLSLVLLLALWVTASQMGEIREKRLEMALAGPLSRTGYYLGRLLGWASAAALCALVASLVLTPFAGEGGAWLWGLSLWCELILIAAFSLAATFSFSQVPAGFAAAAGFYLLARTLGMLRVIGEGPLMGGGEALSTRFLDAFMEGLAFLLPDLSRFTRATWIVYGPEGGELPFILGQTGVYLLLLAGVGLFDLHRKSL